MQSQDLCNFFSMCTWKRYGSYTTLQCAEIGLDSVRQEARLPSEKIHKCPSICAEKISHFSRTTVVNWPVKLLLFRGHSRPRLFALHRSYHRRYMPPLSHSLLKHLRWTWHLNVATQIIVTERLIFFCQSYGTLYRLSKYIQMPWHQRGTERYLESTAFYGPFPIVWHCLLKSNFTRAFFISLTPHIWGPTIANSCVLFFTDNAALVGIL